MVLAFAIYVLILDNRNNKQNIATHIQTKSKRKRSREYTNVFNVDLYTKHKQTGGRGLGLVFAVRVSEHEYMFYFYARHSNPMLCSVHL